MATLFKEGWDKAKSEYPQNQAYLDCFNKNNILKSLHDAVGHFKGKWVENFLKIATDPYHASDVTIEQGTHQPQSTGINTGFFLHFTGRDTDGYAFHFYVKQDSTGQLIITKITYIDGGEQAFVRS